MKTGSFAGIIFDGKEYPISISCRRCSISSSPTRSSGWRPTPRRSSASTARRAIGPSPCPPRRAALRQAVAVGAHALDRVLRHRRLGADRVPLLPVLMVRTLAIALCTVAAAAAAWMAAVRYAVPISGDTAWLRGLYERKEAAARRIAEPKIVLIGGSGTHYSFSAEYLAKRTGIPAVNLGTHAGLGLEYLLYRARRSLRPGDVAVLAIEPPLYHRNTVNVRARRPGRQGRFRVHPAGAVARCRADFLRPRCPIRAAQRGRFAAGAARIRRGGRRACRPGRRIARRFEIRGARQYWHCRTIRPR